MTDPRWQTVREALLTVRREHPRSHRGEPAIAALDSLEAEMEQARDAVQRHYELSVEAIKRGEAAEAENERLRAMIRDWLPDMDSDMQMAFRAALGGGE